MDRDSFTAGNGEDKSILCRTFIDKEHRVFFDTNYEFEVSEIQIGSDYEIKITSAEHLLKKVLPEVEQMDCFSLGVRVELVDLNLQDLHKAIYLC